VGRGGRRLRASGIAARDRAAGTYGWGVAPREELLAAAEPLPTDAPRPPAAEPLPTDEPRPPGEPTDAPRPPGEPFGEP